jgi:hypothetical protein
VGSRKAANFAHGSEFRKAFVGDATEFMESEPATETANETNRGILTESLVNGSVADQSRTAERIKCVCATSDVAAIDADLTVGCAAPFSAVQRCANDNRNGALPIGAQETGRNVGARPLQNKSGKALEEARARAVGVLCLHFPQGKSASCDRGQ